MATVETATFTVLTAAIGGKGYTHVGQLDIEYSSQSAVTLTGIAADANNGSFGFDPITLPSTGGVPTKYFVRPTFNKWKLMWFQFQSTDSAMQVFVEGALAMVKPWGASSAYIPVHMFGESGGEG